MALRSARLAVRLSFVLSFGASLHAQSLPVPVVQAESPAAVSVFSPEHGRTDPTVLIGATLHQILSSMGAPLSVRASRGPESWQDDVVFAYESVELYVFKDRVWQARADSAFGLRSGATRESVASSLGEPFERHENDFVYQRPSRAWPLRLRIRFGADGGAADFFVYRADF